MNAKLSYFIVCLTIVLVSCNNSSLDDVGGNGSTGENTGDNTGGGTASEVITAGDGTPTELTGELTCTDFSNFSITAGADAPAATENVVTAPDAGYEDFVENFLYDETDGTWNTGVQKLSINYAGSGVTCQLYTKKGVEKGDAFSETTTLKDDDGNVDAIVEIDGQHVTVTGYKKYNYELTGTGSNGSSFKLYSDKKFELTLNDVTLQNNNGAAVNIQKGKTSGEDKRGYIILEGTSNLTDGSTYATADDEDEKGVIFSEGKLMLSGTGTLNISCRGKNGMVSDDYIYIHEGPTINITQSVNTYDGIKANDAIYVAGGSTTVINSGAAVYNSTDADFDQPACFKAPDIHVTGGLVQAKATGNGGKGLRCDSVLCVNGGIVRVITTGSTLTKGSSDAEAKGVHVGEKSLKSGEFYMNGGHVSVMSTIAEAVESKHQISVNGGLLEAYSPDDAINAGSSNNGVIVVRGGVVYAYSSGNDAIDSNGTLSFSGGVTFASGTTTPEAAFDCDQNTFSITGGVLIGTGGTSSTPTSASCSQCSFLTTANISNGTRYNVMSSDGTCIASFLAPRTMNGATVLFSSPKLSQGSTYSITTGGTPSLTSEGVGFHGIYAKGQTLSGTTSSLGSVTQSSIVTGSAGSGGGGGNQPGGGGNQPGGGGFGPGGRW